MTIPWTSMQNIQLDGAGGEELSFYGSGYPLVVNDTNRTAYYKYN